MNKSQSWHYLRDQTNWHFFNGGLLFICSMVKHLSLSFYFYFFLGFILIFSLLLIWSLFSLIPWNKAFNWIGMTKFSFLSLIIYLFFANFFISKNHLNLITSTIRWGHDLYYFLTHPLEWKPFKLETYTDPYYLMLNFY